jgi:pimeloyl-ACP methyl ester carboxylesterase
MGSILPVADASPATPGAGLGILPAYGALPRGFRPQIFLNDEDLSRIADPGTIEADTLIVNGEADPIVDAVDAETLGRMPEAELCVVPDTGHFLHVERPHILDIYAEFFERDLEPIGMRESAEAGAADAPAPA